MTPRVFASALLLAAAAPAAADTGGEFRDWAASCTPGLSCSAATYPRSAPVIRSFGLTRGVAADAPLALQLGIGSEEPLSGDVVLGVDGTKVLTLPASGFRKDDGIDLASSDDGVRTALLPRLRDGQSVEVAARVGGRDVSQAFSLSGLVATLRKIDDDQRRVGTPTALIDRGDEPLPDRALLPADVAGADDLPAPVRALWQGAGDCADRDEDNPFGGLGFSTPFGTGARLFVLSCGLPGAYNYPSRLYAYATGDSLADVVPLPNMTDDGPSATLTIWNVDLQGDELRAFFKGRGIGDCGETNTWRIDGQAGTIALVEARSKGDCDGTGAENPDGWPLLWPKR